MKTHRDALETFDDMVRQVDGNGVDLAEQPFMLGPQLHFDRETERFVGNGASAANDLVTGSHRAPFNFPDKV